MWTGSGRRLVSVFVHGLLCFPLFFRCRFVMASSASEMGDSGTAQSQSSRPRGAESSVFSQLALGMQQDGGHVGLTQPMSESAGPVVSSGGAPAAASQLPGPSQGTSFQASEFLPAPPVVQQASTSGLSGTSGTSVSPALSSAPVVHASVSGAASDAGSHGFTYYPGYGGPFPPAGGQFYPWYFPAGNYPAAALQPPWGVQTQPGGNATEGAYIRLPTTVPPAPSASSSVTAESVEQDDGSESSEYEEDISRSNTMADAISLVYLYVPPEECPVPKAVTPESQLTASFAAVGDFSVISPRGKLSFIPRISLLVEMIQSELLGTSVFKYTPNK